MRCVRANSSRFIHFLPSLSGEKNKNVPFSGLRSLVRPRAVLKTSRTLSPIRTSRSVNNIYFFMTFKQSFPLRIIIIITKLYLAKKVKTLNADNYNGRMCGKEPESVAHVLAECGAIMQVSTQGRLRMVQANQAKTSL